jgi:hypothetical protein
MAIPTAPWEGGIDEVKMLQAAMSEAHLVLVRKIRNVSSSGSPS